MNRLLCGTLGAALLIAPFSARSASPSHANPRQTELARQILADKDLRQVHQMALRLLRNGLNAGSGYGQVWIRDLNTFIELGLEVNPPENFRTALLNFIRFQGPQGDIVDGYVALDPARARSAYRLTPLAPGLMAHKNTVETDQESSLVQAVRKYVAITGDTTILDERIAGQTVRDSLGRALEYVLTERFDPPHGLVWGGTTIDWGDVQPESPRGVVLDNHSHPALSIYNNAMLVIAISDYLELIGNRSPEAAHWRAARDALRHNIRLHLWDASRQKFIPHVYLHGSPFPRGFDENAIYYHGGTAVAIEAGLLNHREVWEALQTMIADVRAAGASSIGLTIYPPYPDGYFKNPQLTRPYTYQNGGDWTWFGGRMIQDLVRAGYVEQAYLQVRPMVERVRRVHGFYEWWTPDNQPRGSGDFRGSAGVLGRAIELLQNWSKHTEMMYGK